MAKNSMIARENKRTRTVKRFAARRAELKVPPIYDISADDAAQIARSRQLKANV